MKNKTEVTLIIHSFVDLITNSSSETFISCNTQTIQCVKDLINSLLKLQTPDTKLTADDLFVFEVVDQYDDVADAADEETATSLKVTAKNQDSKEAIDIAKKLTHLEDAFSAVEIYQ